MKTVKVSVSELTGPALDWAVAKATGGTPWLTPFGGIGFDSDCWAMAPFSPSTDWSQGGTLVARHQIAFAKLGENWEAFLPKGKAYELSATGEFYMDVEEFDGDGYGETHLIAACRAIVAAKLGDSVEVPAELVGAL